MSHLFAMVRPDSSVAFVASMGISEADSAMPIAQGLRCIVPPDGVSAEELVTEWFYRDTWVKSPPKPSPFHQLDLTTYLWSDPRTLQERKNVKWEAIKKQRTAAEGSGFDVAGLGRFDSDQVSQGRIQGGVQLSTLIPGFSIDWTLADNTVVTLDATQMVNVGLSLGQHIGLQHIKARTLRAQISAATTTAELDLIVWPATP